MRTGNFQVQLSGFFWAGGHVISRLLVTTPSAQGGVRFIAIDQYAERLLPSI